jgi:hypothetical protein
MRAGHLIVGFFCAASFLGVGCGNNVAPKVSCSDDSLCRRTASPIYDGVDAGPELLPHCCSGACMIPSSGCDSGYRYLTSQPALGDCAVSPQCPKP